MKFSNAFAAGAALLSLVLLTLNLRNASRIRKLEARLTAPIPASKASPPVTAEASAKLDGLESAIREREAQLKSITENLGEMRSRVDTLRKSMGLLSRIPPNPWKPVQATGAPNCDKGRDSGHAWCPAKSDSDEEWLLLTFDEDVALAAVRVHENFNPGALVRGAAVVIGDGGEASEVEFWKRSAAGAAGSGIMVIKPVAGEGAPAPPVTRRIKLYLSPKSVPGWNEIDAVQLIGADGSEQWAAEAAASSFWIQGPMRVPG